MIEFISCTDGPQATGPVANLMYIHPYQDLW